MKLVSWNVNGLRSAWRHGLLRFLIFNHADIFCFQETKLNEPFPEVVIPGFTPTWSFCENHKGYSGTLILSKEEPLSVSTTLSDPEFDDEGRIITAEFDGYYLVNCYFPMSQGRYDRAEYRDRWDTLLQWHLIKLRCRKPVIICGDMNATLSDADIYEENLTAERESDAFRSIERENLSNLIASGFVDTFRLKHPKKKDCFTWWSQRFSKRKNNQGFRLDYFLVSDKLVPAVKDSRILSEVYGSDHCPILLDLDFGERTSEEEPVHLHPSSFTFADVRKWENSNVPISVRQDVDASPVWDTIDWDEVEADLAKMQRELTVMAAAKSYKWIAEAQERIVRSLSARVLAVRHVCETASGVGVDAIKWETSHDKFMAALALVPEGYTAMPSRMFLKDDPRGRERHFQVLTYHDRAMQTLYAYALDPVAEAWADHQSFAFRKGRSQFDMNECIRRTLSGSDAPEWVVVADVQQCYHNISHEWVMNNIPLDKSILHEFLNAGYTFAGQLFPTNRGLGLGCNISPIIANMTLDGIQQAVYDLLQPDGIEDYSNGSVIRFADDVFVACKSFDEAKRVMELLGSFLEPRGLSLSPEKSRIAHMDEGFDFMSRHYQRVNGVLKVTPTEAAVDRFRGSLEELILNHTGSQKSLIEKINDKVSGWAAYHKVEDADEAFRQVDAYIESCLVALCEAKHPRWSRKKIVERYFIEDYKHRYVYSLRDRRDKRVRFLADTMPIRYDAVWMQANPYKDTDYFDRRSRTRDIMNVTGRYAQIMQRQNRRCHYCGMPILSDERKMVIEAYPDAPKFTSRMVYIHERCSYASFEHVITDAALVTLEDAINLMESLAKNQRPDASPYFELSEFFRNLKTSQVTLTFPQIEEITGQPLPPAAMKESYWYNDGLDTICQAWQDNGFEVRTVRLEGIPKVSFRMTEAARHTSFIKLPPFMYRRIPEAARFELEEYMKDVARRYGL